ncbi:MAG: ATP-dependent zinc metalloprotease FtsH [Bacillota bacterium]
MRWTRIFHSVAFYLVLLFLVLTVVQYIAGQSEAPAEYSYSQFLGVVESDRVAGVDIFYQTGGTGRAEGSLKDGSEFVTTVPTNDPLLLELLRKHEVNHQIHEPESASWWMALLTSFLPVLLVIGAFFFIMQQSQGGGNRVMQFGRSRAQVHSPEHAPNVTFDDVAGIDEVQAELEEVTDFLKSPRKYIKIGARIPKGVLLVGPPGTGKTLVARAVAGEAGVPFFSISGSDFVEMFVGVGASRVRDLFEQAKKSAPAIVFIDEIDAVGRQRGAGYGGGHDEREQTLNQLLVEMDGFGVNEGVIIMAATNRPDVLDPALLRPGRFDRLLTIHRPDLEGRRHIFGIHLRGKPLSDDVDSEILARRTPGFTGADIENVVNEAALLAARKNKAEVDMHDFEEAIDRIMAGGPEKRSQVISEKEKRIVAYHEAGHALAADLLPNTDPIHKISIIPRGGALGYVLQMPLEDRYLVTKGEILDRVTMALAGRAAEVLIFDEISTGAQDDLEKSTTLVRKMITEYGMSEELGPLTYGDKMDNPFLGRDITRGRNYSEEVASAIDREIKKTVASAYERARNLLIEHRDSFEKLATSLLERETLEGDEVRSIIRAVEGNDGKPQVEEEAVVDDEDAADAGSRAGRAVSSWRVINEGCFHMFRGVGDLDPRWCEI